MDALFVITCLVCFGYCVFLVCLISIICVVVLYWIVAYSFVWLLDWFVGYFVGCFVGLIVFGDCICFVFSCFVAVSVV